MAAIPRRTAQESPLSLHEIFITLIFPKYHLFADLGPQIRNENVVLLAAFFFF